MRYVYERVFYITKRFMGSAVRGIKTMKTLKRRWP